MSQIEGPGEFLGSAKARESERLLCYIAGLIGLCAHLNKTQSNMNSAIPFSMCMFVIFQYIASPHPYPFYHGPGTSIIHAVPIADSEQTSNAASPDDNYQPYQTNQAPK